jgi:hypothetical protein
MALPSKSPVISSRVPVPTSVFTMPAVGLLEKLFQGRRSRRKAARSGRL